MRRGTLAAVVAIVWALALSSSVLAAPATSPGDAVFVSGTFAMPDGSEPTGTVLIAIQQPDQDGRPGKSIAFAQFEKTGGFNFIHSIPSGSYVISVFANNETVVRQPLEVGDKSPLDVKLVAASGGVEGTITDSAGKPAAHVRVALACRMPPRAYSAETDDAGHYQIHYAMPGHYLLVAGVNTVANTDNRQVAVDRDFVVGIEIVKKDLQLQSKPVRKRPATKAAEEGK